VGAGVIVAASAGTSEGIGFTTAAGCACGAGGDEKLKPDFWDTSAESAEGVLEMSLLLVLALTGRGTLALSGALTAGE
jgi:hypothetical protein